MNGNSSNLGRRQMEVADKPMTESGAMRTKFSCFFADWLKKQKMKKVSTEKRAIEFTE